MGNLGEPGWAVDEALPDLILCFVCRAEKGRQELGGPDTQDIAEMPYRCLKAMFFPLLNEGLD